MLNHKCVIASDVTSTKSCAESGGGLMVGRAGAASIPRRPEISCGVLRHAANNSSASRVLLVCEGDPIELVEKIDVLGVMSDVGAGGIERISHPLL